MRTQTIRLGEEQDPPGPAAATSAERQATQEPSAIASEDPEHAVAAVSSAAPPVVEEIKQAVAPAPAQVPSKPPVDSKPPQPITPVSAPRAAQGGWVVQLGSFSEEENARRLAQRVATFGYSPDISNHRASGRTMYRVRVGPHESRARADAAASALSAHGFVAQVVTAD